MSLHVQCKTIWRIQSSIVENKNSMHANITTGIKPIINITSESITPEKNIELLKADFVRSNDYDTAIKIASFYYNNKIYNDAIKWALNASSADSKDKQKVDSWIIYSKSLYASGKKEQAISVLENYILTTNSKFVKDVLNNMKKGVI